MNRSFWLLVLLAMGLLTSSAGEVELIKGMVIENLSQFALEEVRIHEEPDYHTAENLLTEHLEIGEDLMVQGTGNIYITVYREHYDRGPLLALTTSTPVAVQAERSYRLLVFDEYFRFEELFPPGPATDAEGGCSCSSTSGGMLRGSQGGLQSNFNALTER